MGKSFGDVSFLFVHIALSSVSVAEWPHLGTELLTQLNICSLYILTIFNFCYLRAAFGF